MPILQDIINAEPREAYQVWLQFEDNTAGVINIADLIPFTGVFAPLQDEIYFRQLHVNPELGTICWPNGADLDPDVLYDIVIGLPVSLQSDMVV
jgi:hypothetical protein